MRPISPDTSVEAQQKHFELMRRLPGWKRLQFAFELTQATREMALSDIRYRFPRATDEQVRRRFIARVLRREDVIRAYGFDPNDDLIDCD